MTCDDEYAASFAGLFDMPKLKSFDLSRIEETVAARLSVQAFGVERTTDSGLNKIAKADLVDLRVLG